MEQIPSQEPEEPTLKGISALLISNQKMLRVKKILTILNVLLIITIIASAYILYKNPNVVKEGESTHQIINYYRDGYNEYTDAGGIKVHHIEGWVNNNSEVTILHLYLGLYSGTSTVDVEQQLLVHLMWTPGVLRYHPGGEADLLHTNNTSLSNDLEMFTHNITMDPHKSMEYSGALDSDSVIMIEIDFNKFRNSTKYLENKMSCSSSVTIKFIFDPNENSNDWRCRVPYTLSDKSGWVELF